MLSLSSPRWRSPARLLSLLPCGLQLLLACGSEDDPPSTTTTPTSVTLDPGSSSSPPASGSTGDAMTSAPAAEGSSAGSTGAAGSTTGGTLDPASATTTTPDGSEGGEDTGAAPTGACPDDASFCSGFEESGLPAGATYRPSYQMDGFMNNMAFDTDVVWAGEQSLRIEPGADGYDWRMLSVAAPGPAFWVRLYMRSDTEIGQPDHNAYFQAMTGDGEPNTGNNMEVAEQYCQIVLNRRDEVVVSIGGQTMCDTGISLPADTWHCMEAYFDGPGGVVQVYADGEPVIDSSGWPADDYQTFSFGFLSFHGPARTMWYDDVAVAPERIGCAG